MFMEKTMFIAELNRSFPVISPAEVEARKIGEGSFEHNRETISYVIFQHENKRLMAVSTNTDERTLVFPNLENQDLNFPVLRDLYWNGLPSMVVE